MLKLILFALLYVGSFAVPSSRYVNFKPDGSYRFHYTIGNPIFHQQRMEYGASVGSPQDSPSNPFFGYSITDGEDNAMTSLVNTDEKDDKEPEKLGTYHSKDEQQLTITNNEDEKDEKTINEDEEMEVYAQASKYVDTNDQNEKDPELTVFFPTIPYGRRRLSVHPTTNENNKNVNFKVVNPGFYNPFNNPLTTDDKVRPLRYVPQNPFSYWPQYHNYILRETGGKGKISETQTFPFQDYSFPNPASFKDNSDTEGKESDFQLSPVQYFPQGQLSVAEKDNTQVKPTQTKTQPFGYQYVPLPGYWNEKHAVSSVESTPNKLSISPFHYSPFPLIWFVGHQAPGIVPYEKNKGGETTPTKEVQESSEKSATEVVKSEETIPASENVDNLKDGETSVPQNFSSEFQRFLNSFTTSTSEVIPGATKQVSFHHYVPHFYHHFPRPSASLTPFIIPVDNTKTKTSSW